MSYKIRRVQRDDFMKQRDLQLRINWYRRLEQWKFAM